MKERRVSRQRTCYNSISNRFRSYSWPKVRNKESRNFLVNAPVTTPFPTVFAAIVDQK